jgi:hypothetical protein
MRKYGHHTAPGSPNPNADRQVICPEIVIPGIGRHLVSHQDRQAPARRCAVKDNYAADLETVFPEA